MNICASDTVQGRVLGEALKTEPSKPTTRERQGGPTEQPALRAEHQRAHSQPTQQMLPPLSQRISAGRPAAPADAEGGLHPGGLILLSLPRGTFHWCSARPRDTHCALLPRGLDVDIELDVLAVSERAEA